MAALPAGAAAHPDSSEASEAGWLAPARALAEHGRGERPMLPPTVLTLRELVTYERVDDVLAAASARSLAPVEPVLVDVEGRRSIRLPDGRHIHLPAR